jgi:hypothetical protein
MYLNGYDCDGQKLLRSREIAFGAGTKQWIQKTRMPCRKSLFESGIHRWLGRVTKRSRLGVQFTTVTAWFAIAPASRNSTAAAFEACPHRGGSCGGA